ncbi:hypothetical protein GTV32_01715 [Gordonia sp. SID5947]|uniref:hypothetical protein n=1 Tax=Gordonia sp. SID5947 TaxID=2690315 RepID=UPI00136949BC|nr:hypothetical protein [Gordonia sp. SID5947]MYR05127.1 hypothetical protein [Gordonia sp. SID5947]
MLRQQHPYTPAPCPDRPSATQPPKIRLHDARHSVASQMIDGGQSALTTAAWLGHDPAMTLRVYGHAFDDSLAAAGADLFAPPVPSGD